MMANKMINCKTCNTEIAVSAKTCPSCGAKNKKPFFKRWWVWVIVIAVALIAANNGGDDKPVVRDQGSSPPPVVRDQGSSPPPEEKTPIVVISDQLIAELRENALRASNTYKGEYVEVTGRLSNIDSSGKYFSISEINNEYSFDSILCNIKEEHLDTVSDFTKDQKVTVVGTIKSVGEVLGYSLDVDYIK